MNKYRHGIVKVEVGERTFKAAPASFEPTLINFFFGNNGTGKSTIAQAIADQSGVTWEDGQPQGEYEILLYDRAYVKNTFLDYGNLKGIFTGSKQATDDAVTIETMRQEKKQCDADGRNAKAAAEKKQAEIDTQFERFSELAWSETVRIRRELSKALNQARNWTGYGRSKDAFARRLLDAYPAVEYDYEALKILYDTAFGEGGRRYSRFSKPGSLARLAPLASTHSLLGQAIISRSSTAYARFVNALKSSAWIKQGHDLYHHNPDNPDSLCPYCHRPMQDTIETDIASCFDEQYQRDVEQLKQLLEAYKLDFAEQVAVYEGNLQLETLERISLDEYRAKLELLKKLIEGNVVKIQNKVADPSLCVTLDDIKTIRKDLNTLVDGFNAIVDENNAILDQQALKQQECREHTLQYIKFTLRSAITAYRTSYAALDKERRNALSIYDEKDRQSRDLDAQIREKGKDTVGTQQTIDAVNKTLKDAGLQGFRLCPHKSVKNGYEVLRDDGTPVDNLSEGERNFIAFLYFYHTVRGSFDESGEKKRKIIIIDDPVTSMDSSVMFLVSHLVRVLVEICYNNVNLAAHTFRGEDVDQIFIFTHNTYFHREVTYDQAGRFDFVTFYLVTKRGNVSRVAPCYRENRDYVPPVMENRNPVTSSYMALWSELRELTSGITTMSVIRRILEYYFIQLVGHEGDKLRERILGEENRGRFIDRETGDDTKYILAQSMLRYIGRQDIGFNDGIDFVDESADASQCLEVFRIIFECMDSQQHLNMMMNEVASEKRRNTIRTMQG